MERRREQERERDDEEEEEGGDGLFGSIGFMFDTAREKITRDFAIALPLPVGNAQESRGVDVKGADRDTGQSEGRDDSQRECVGVSLYVIDDDPGHVQSGQYLWPAAFSLSNYLINNWGKLVSGYFEGRVPSVVELGSGIGMCGIFVAKYLSDVAMKETSSTSSTSVFLTDYDPGCLEMLSDNIQLNSVDNICSVARVEWGKKVNLAEENGAAGSTGHRFLVIGSDLLYCVSIVRPLLITVRSLLQSIQSSGNGEKEMCQENLHG